MPKLPELAPVESTMVEGWHYSPETKAMTIKFKGSGKVYVYEDVSPERAATVAGAESFGRAFNAHVKPHHVAREVFGSE